MLELELPALRLGLPAACRFCYTATAGAIPGWCTRTPNQHNWEDGLLSDTTPCLQLVQIKRRSTMFIYFFKKCISFLFQLCMSLEVFKTNWLRVNWTSGRLELDDLWDPFSTQTIQWSWDHELHLEETSMKTSDTLKKKISYRLTIQLMITIR